MNWQKAIGYGLLWWVLVFAAISVLVAFGLYAGPGGEIAGLVIAVLIAGALASRLQPADLKTGLTYGAAWVVVGLVLDAVITTRFDPGIFSAPTLWVGYVLVLFTPAAVAQFRQSKVG